MDRERKRAVVILYICIQEFALSVGTLIFYGSFHILISRLKGESLMIHMYVCTRLPVDYIHRRDESEDKYRATIITDFNLATMSLCH